MTANGGINGSAALTEDSEGKGQVDFADLAPGELLGEGAVSRVRFCDDQTPAGLFIQAMDDARSFIPAFLGQILAVVQEGVHDRSGPISDCGVHHHSRRLVDHQQLCILVKNLERQILSLCGHRLPLWLPDGNLYAGPHAFSGLGYLLTLHTNASHSNPILQLGATVPGKKPAQKLIQTDPIPAPGGFKMMHARFGHHALRNSLRYRICKRRDSDCVCARGAIGFR
ncbi:MAG: hypothetical protein RLZZ399_32 [Verrucomicrobiota bacterium]